MEDLIELIISVLFWPYFWWHGHNESSRLGTSPDEDKAEQFWLKFAIYGSVIAGMAFALYYFESGSAHWAATSFTP